MQSLGKHPSLSSEGSTETITALRGDAFDIATSASLDIFTDL